jgi:hypothetical protein
MASMMRPAAQAHVDNLGRRGIHLDVVERASGRPEDGVGDTDKTPAAVAVECADGLNFHLPVYRRRAAGIVGREDPDCPSDVGSVEPVVGPDVCGIRIVIDKIPTRNDVGGVEVGMDRDEARVDDRNHYVGLTDVAVPERG